MKKDYDSTRIYRNTHKKRVRHRLMTHPLVIFLFLYQVLQILVSRNTLQFILDNLFDFLLDKMQEKLNDMMRRDDELERMRRGKSVKSCFLQLLYIFAVFYFVF